MFISVSFSVYYEERREMKLTCNRLKVYGWIYSKDNDLPFKTLVNRQFSWKKFAVISALIVFLLYIKSKELLGLESFGFITLIIRL